MEPKNILFEKLTARIILTKNSFFGLKRQYIIFWVTINFRILKIINNYGKNNLNIPFNEKNNLDINTLKKWALNNDFLISFTTKNPTLKRQLFGEFEDILEESTIPKKKYSIFKIKTKNNPHSKKNCNLHKKNIVLSVI